jgi:hypothetical protein
MGVRLDAGAGRNPFSDPDHGAPFGEARSQFPVLVQSIAKPVEPLGDGLPGASGERLRPPIHLDAGDHALVLEDLHERRAIGAFLPKGFVEEDHAADVARHAVGPKQKLPVVPTILFRAFHANRRQALRHGSGALVGGKDALAGCHHAASRVHQRVRMLELNRHFSSPVTSAERRATCVMVAALQLCVCVDDVATALPRAFGNRAARITRGYAYQLVA